MRTASIHETAELDLTRRSAEAPRGTIDQRIYEGAAYFLRKLNDAETSKDVVSVMIDIATMLEKAEK